MINELEILLDKIQVKTNLSLEEIAKKIGRSRPYLNKQKSNGGKNKKLIALLKDRFPKILQNDTPQTSQISGSTHGASSAAGTIIAKINSNELLEFAQVNNELSKKILWALGRLISKVEKKDMAEVMNEINKPLADKKLSIVSKGKTLKKGM